jgi:4-aminobutyrate aminotransferase
MDWPPGSHASTFGGNPVSWPAALATLDLLEAGYMANAAARGEQLRQGLRRLQQAQPAIGEVRGLGLMTAMDLVSSRDPYTYAPTLRDDVVQRAFEQGLLLLGCGESAVRFCAPLCVTAEQVRGAGILDGCSRRSPRSRDLVAAGRRGKSGTVTRAWAQG